MVLFIDHNLKSIIFAYCGFNFNNRQKLGLINRQAAKICRCYLYIIFLDTPDIATLFKYSYQRNIPNLLTICLKNPRLDCKEKIEGFQTISREGYIRMAEILLADVKKCPLLMQDRLTEILSAEMLYAAEGGQVEIIKLLLTEQNIESRYINGSFELACRDGYLEIVKMLLADSRCNPGDNNNSAITMAASQGRWEIVKILLADPRIDPTAGNNNAIKVASRSRSYNGHLEVVRILLADPRVAKSLSARDKAFYQNQIRKLDKPQ